MGLNAGGGRILRWQLLADPLKLQLVSLLMMELSFQQRMRNWHNLGQFFFWSLGV